MTCQRCSAEATVHLTEEVDGELTELHLCARCAQDAGLPAPSKPAGFALDAVIQGLITANVGELVGELARRKCPDCGLTFLEFRVGGRLGCPNDYETFRAGILPLVGRAQGASRHVGKQPARRRNTASGRLRLRARLRDAIAQEDYEVAAALRDQLRQEDTDA